MTFKVLLHKNASKFLGDLDAATRKRMTDRLRELEEFPSVRLDIVKIAGEEDTFRLRLGKLRALFKVYGEEKVIVVVRIDFRRRVYRG